jgi:hypothetical protein
MQASNSRRGRTGRREARRTACRAAVAALMALGIICGLPRAARAQEARDSAAGARAAEQWEDVLLLEAIRYLRLRPQQLQAIVPLADTAEARMAKLREQEGRTLAELERLGRRSREALVTGRPGMPKDQSDALTLRGTIRHRRAQAEVEVIQHVAPRLARILTREQALLAYLLAMGLPPEDRDHGQSPALLDREAGFVLDGDAQEQLREAAIRQALAQRYPPEILDALSHRAVVRWQTNGSVHGDVLATREFRLSLSDGWRDVPSYPSIRFFLDTDGGEKSDPRLQQAEQEMDWLREHGDALAQQLLAAASSEDPAAWLRPLVRRMFLSPRLKPVLQERVGRTNRRE